jgi:hypothetical protein
MDCFHLFHSCLHSSMALYKNPSIILCVYFRRLGGIDAVGRRCRLCNRRASYSDCALLVLITLAVFVSFSFGLEKSISLCGLHLSLSRVFYL